jgi:hypothetical protein
MPHIVVGRFLWDPRGTAAGSCGAVQRLHLAPLVHAEHPRPLRRMEYGGRRVPDFASSCGSVENLNVSDRRGWGLTFHVALMVESATCQAPWPGNRLDHCVTEALTWRHDPPPPSTVLGRPDSAGHAARRSLAGILRGSGNALPRDHGKDRLLPAGEARHWKNAQPKARPPWRISTTAMCSKDCADDRCSHVLHRLIGPERG